MNGQLLGQGSLPALEGPRHSGLRAHSTGEVPAVRLGKYLRYRLDQIEQFERSFTDIEPPRRAV